MLLVFLLLMPLLFLSVYIYLIRKDFLLVVGFIFFLHIFLKFLFFKFFPSIAFATGIFINISILFFFLYVALGNPSLLQKKVTVHIIGSIVFFLIYLSLIALLRNHNPFAYWDFVKNYFFHLLLIPIYFVSKPKLRISTTYYIKVFCYMFLAQIVLGTLQYYVPGISDLFKVIEYQRLGEVVQGLSDTWKNQKLVLGTLMSFTNLAIFLQIGIVFLFIIANKTTLNKVYINAIIVSGVFVMLLTGVRAPLIGLVVGLIVFFWYKNRFLFFVSIMVIAVLGVFLFTNFQYIIEYATTHEVSANTEDPFQRILGVLAVFNSEALLETTFGRTLEIFRDLFRNPFFGSGPGLIFSDYSYTDAFLIIIIVEFGLIGLLLMIYPYFYLTRRIKRYSHELYGISIILLITVLSQSIVNEGLWAHYANIQFIFLALIILRMGQEHNVSFLIYREVKGS